MNSYSLTKHQVLNLISEHKIVVSSNEHMFLRVTTDSYDLRVIHNNVSHRNYAILEIVGQDHLYNLDESTSDFVYYTMMCIKKDQDRKAKKDEEYKLLNELHTFLDSVA